MQQMKTLKFEGSSLSDLREFPENAKKVAGVIMKTETVTSSGDVFKDLGFPAEEAEKLNIKSQLMLEVRKYIEKNNLTQEKAAEIMGVTRTRISDATRGKIEKFTIDALIDMLSKAGKHFVIKIKNAA